MNKKKLTELSEKVERLELLQAQNGLEDYVKELNEVKSDLKCLKVSEPSARLIAFKKSIAVLPAAIKTFTFWFKVLCEHHDMDDVECRKEYLEALHSLEEIQKSCD